MMKWRCPTDGRMVLDGSGWCAFGHFIGSSLVLRMKSWWTNQGFVEKTSFPPRETATRDC